MKKEILGYNKQLEVRRINLGLQEFDIGRVIAEHKERYIVKTEVGEFEAEITGNLRYSALGREDYPAVGDWVALITADEHFAIIHSILPRQSVIGRKAAGQIGETQIIASNVDYALLVQAVDRDFNINRLERYLSICYSSKVEPIIVLTKTDLIGTEDLNEILAALNQRIKNVEVVPLSNENRQGYEHLNKLIKTGKTYCMLGSSGVGKSTLSNNLCGSELMKTNAISKSTAKGRHVTTHRQLILMENGGILIDNPGMREVGLSDTSEGLEATFSAITKLSENCKFKNCTHTSETGCAVLKALTEGIIDEHSYQNYLKMEKENAFFESSVAERRKKDKAFGKMVKNVKKKNIRNKF